MKSIGVTSALLLTFVLGGLSGLQAQVRPVLRPSDICSDQTGEAVATFEDAGLEAAIRAALSVDADQDLTCSMVSGLTGLTAQSAGIESLVGIQNLTGLTRLNLPSSSITSASASTPIEVRASSNAP